jgi:hypothetical protein
VDRLATKAAIKIDAEVFMIEFPGFDTKLRCIRTLVFSGIFPVVMPVDIVLIWIVTKTR